MLNIDTETNEIEAYDTECMSENSDNYKISTNTDINSYSYQCLTVDTKKTLSIYSEIRRYHIINGLNEYFQLKLNKLDKSKYNVNELFRNSSSKLIELINRWCWHQYNNSSCMDDVIPYVNDGKYDYTRFTDDLNYILDTYGKPNQIKIDDLIIVELKETINNYLKVEYYKFSNLETIKLNIIKETNDKKIRLSCDYKSNIYQVLIHSKVYNRLKMKLIMFGKKYEIMKDYMDNLDNLLDEYIFCLTFRYSYMDSGNQQLAISHYIKDMFRKYNVNFELFGSAINTVSDNYCSLFYDIEKYFGSNGNFFDIQIDSGIYWCNPPYDDTIMLNTARKLVDTLKTNNQVAFLVTIPIWDVYTQNRIKNDNIENIRRNYNTKTTPELHTDFQIYSLLKPYIKDELIIPKHRIPYFNYKKYSHINAVNTYMLIVYNSIDNEISSNLHNNFTKIVDLDKMNFFIK